MATRPRAAWRDCRPTTEESRRPSRARAPRPSPSSGCAATCGWATTRRCSPPRSRHGPAAAACFPSTCGNLRAAATGLRAARRAGGCDVRWSALTATCAVSVPGCCSIAANRCPPSPRSRGSSQRPPWSGPPGSNRTRPPTTVLCARPSSPPASRRSWCRKPACSSTPSRAHARRPTVHRLHSVLARPPGRRPADRTTAGPGRASARAGRAARPAARRPCRRFACVERGLRRHLAARRDRRTRTSGGLPRRPPASLCRRPRPTRPRGQFADLASPALGRADRPPGVARGRRSRGRGRPGPRGGSGPGELGRGSGARPAPLGRRLSPSARLARVRPPPAHRLPTHPRGAAARALRRPPLARGS